MEDGSAAYVCPQSKCFYPSNELYDIVCTISCNITHIIHNSYIRYYIRGRAVMIICKS